MLIWDRTAASLDTVGPELVIGLAAVGLLLSAAQHFVVVRRAAIPAPAGSSQIQSPPELTALVARWGITDFAIWLREDHRLDDHAARAVTGWGLRLSLVLPAVSTFTPWIWAATAASIVVHGVVTNWAAELYSDRIAVAHHGYPQMVSFADRTHTSKHWPSYTHPPYAWRMWPARTRSRP